VAEDDPAVVAGGALVGAGGAAAAGVTGAGVVVEVLKSCMLVVGAVCLGPGLELIFP
jgi:hypothetical protein